MCFVSVDSSAHLTQGLNGKQSAFPAPNRQRLNKDAFTVEKLIK